MSDNMQAGRGRKQCPSCNLYVGVRTQTCGCGHSFDGKDHSGTAVVPKRIESTEGGKGRKQCPSCKLYVGVRTQTCGCGHAFERKNSLEPTPVMTPAVIAAPIPNLDRPLPDVQSSRDFGLSVVSIPAGECPVDLKSDNREDILDWSSKVQQHYRTQRQKLLVSGLVYFARQLFDFQSKEFLNIKTVLLETHQE